jgi:predicted peptidase
VSGGGIASGQNPSASVPRLAPGVYARTLQTDSGPIVNYTISVPKGYSEADGVPLVVALHFSVAGRASDGAGGDLLRVLVGPALADLGAVIIAPDTLGGSWDTGGNEQAVMRLLNETLKAYHADPHKVAVTGFSMGGTGAWRYAAKFPDTFSAAIPVAGRPSEDAGQWRVPVFAVHSQRDEVIRIIPTTRRIAELKKMGVDARLVVLKEPTHYQTHLYVDGLKQAVPWLRSLWNH